MPRGRKREDRSLSSIAKVGNRLIYSDARIVYVVIRAKATRASSVSSFPRRRRAHHLCRHSRDGDPRIIYVVIPAKAGIHWLLTNAKWIPAFAGMTRVVATAIAHFGNPFAGMTRVVATAIAHFGNPFAGMTRVLQPQLPISVILSRG
jgi:hypothetical protein